MGISKKPDPALKGVKGGNCNVTSCQLPGAVYYNKSTMKHYCKPCADEINWPGGRTDTFKLYGTPLLCELSLPEGGRGGATVMSDNSEVKFKGWLVGFIISSILSLPFFIGFSFSEAGIQNSWPIWGFLPALYLLSSIVVFVLGSFVLGSIYLAKRIMGVPNELD